MDSLILTFSKLIKLNLKHLILWLGNGKDIKNVHYVNDTVLILKFNGSRCDEHFNNI